MWVPFRNTFEHTDFRDLLRNTTFLRLFAGRVITDTGDSLYFIGAMWLIWELTGSPFYTGLAGALVMVPNALSVFIGPLVDRWQLRRILLSTQVINGVGVLVVPIAAMTGYLSVWLILILMPVLTFVNGFVYPAQNAALPRIVGKNRLTRANSLFSTSIQTVDMVANAVAGALITVIGAVTLFVVNAITFVIAAILFVGVTVPKTAHRDASNEPENSDESENSTESKNNDGESTTDDGYVAELHEGIDYVRGSALSAMLLGMMVSNFGAMAATAVLPAFADSLAGPTAFGLLVAASGAGNLIGAGGAFLVEDYPFGWVAIIGFPLSGVSWVAAVAVPGVWPTVALWFVASIPIGAFNVLFGSMYQSAVNDALLGRVSSLVRTLAMAMAPAGAFIGGAIASIVGSVTVMYGTGGAIAFLGLYYLVHPGLRSLPPVAEVDEAALGLHSTTNNPPEPIETGSGYGSE